MAVVQVAKWGNSLAVRIPKNLAEEARMQEGDLIIIEASAEGLALRHSERVPTLAELVAQIKPENRYGEVGIGKEQGKEQLEW